MSLWGLNSSVPGFPADAYRTVRILPKTIPGQIDFLTAHLPVWASDPDAVGLAPGEIDGLAALLDEAQKAQNLARKAREAALAATRALHEVGTRLASATSIALGRIKLAARADDEVYVAAQIPVPLPSNPTRVTPPPGTPTNFRITLRQVGVLELAWTCPNPRGTQGTLYEVARRVHTLPGAPGTPGAAGQTSGDAFVHLGVVSAKSFADEKLPVGAASVEYQVTALRAGLKTTQRGQPARFGVQLGTATPTHVGTRAATRDVAAKANTLAA